MNQSGLRSIYLPVAGASFAGGICKWWYAPVKWLQLPFPKINRVSQRYEQEPALLPGYNWIGPIKVPDAKRGFAETQEPDKPGVFFKQTVAAYEVGDSQENRILRQNMTPDEYIVVAKMRTGMYLVLGNHASGLKYDHAFNSGKGANTSFAGADFTMSGEATHNATVLAAFSGDIAPPIPINRGPFYGVVPTNRLPTTTEIEAGAVAVPSSSSRGNYFCDFRSTLQPAWFWVAEDQTLALKRSYYANALSYGPIGGRRAVWDVAGTVPASTAGNYRVYLVNFQTLFLSDIVEFRVL